MKIVASGFSDVGCVRTSNEDSFGLFPDLNLFVLADGMGGHAAGEVASKMAVDRIKSYFLSPPEQDISELETTQTSETRLNRAIAYANHEIFLSGSSDPALSGMGTTIVALFSTPEESVVGFVGDSRLYRLKDETIQQLTQDHSMVNEYVQKGLITAEAAERHPQKHVLSRAMGTGAKVSVETFTIKPELGDTYLLCSDGLSNKLSADEMCTIVCESSDSESACKSLIQGAIKAGGEDNITVILASYVA